MFQEIFSTHDMKMTPVLAEYLERKEYRKGVKRKYEKNGC